MPNDAYADVAPAQAPEAPSAEKPAPEEDAGKTPTTIPKEALGGMEPKVGDRCTFEIVQVNEDSVLAEYVSEGEEEAPPEEAPPPGPPPGAGGGMSSMME